MRVLDLFSGLGGATAPWVDRGHEIVTVDDDTTFAASLTADIMEVRPGDLEGPFDFIWASPPCQAFSVMTISQCWTSDGKPKKSARKALALIAATLELIAELRPRAWIMENPVGMLRVQEVVRPYERRTVTYCRYGMPYRKATDLWGGFPPTLHLRPTCRPGARCHQPNPRSTKGGAQKPIGGAMAFEYYARHGSPYRNPPLRGEAPYIKAARPGRDGMQAVSLAWIRETWEQLNGPNEEARSSRTGRAALRALVPYELGFAVCEAMERWNGVSWEASTLKPWLRDGN